MGVLALVALVVAVIALLALRRQRGKAGIRSWVMDQDLEGKGRKVYHNPSMGLSCKPDVVERRRIIEYKSAAAKGRARPGDILYVAAQLLSTGKKEVVIRYADNAFVFQGNSARIQAAMQRVRSILGQMRRALKLQEIPRGTPTPNKCRVCMFSSACSDRST